MAALSFHPVVIADSVADLDAYEGADAGTLGVVFTGGAPTLYAYDGTNWATFVPA